MSFQLKQIACNNFFLCEVGSKKTTSSGYRLSVVPGVVSILSEDRQHTAKQQQEKKVTQDAVRGNSRGSY